LKNKLQKGKVSGPKSFAWNKAIFSKIKNDLLRTLILRVCCDHGLAAVGIAKHRCDRRRLIGREQVSSPQI